jgi:hypothetical protein
MPNTRTPGQVAHAAYNAAYDPEMVWGESGWFGLPRMTQAAWEAAAQAVRDAMPQTMTLLYIVVMQEGIQLQLCGAYPSAEEAGVHLAHARTIMPDRNFAVRVCPFALSGQAHRQEDPHA